MTQERPSALRRLWLLTAQVIAISAGVIVAWRAFGPSGPEAPVAADVVAVQEAPHTPAGAASAASDCGYFLVRSSRTSLSTAIP